MTDADGDAIMKARRERTVGKIVPREADDMEVIA